MAIPGGSAGSSSSRGRPFQSADRAPGQHGRAQGALRSRNAQRKTAGCRCAPSSLAKGPLYLIITGERGLRHAFWHTVSSDSRG
jgi:hypothetical protein